jgi:hypothetical protein
MDLMIEGYVKDNFHPDMATEIFRTMEIFDNFDLRDYELALKDIVIGADESIPEETHDRFINQLQIKQNYILQQHSVIVNDDIKIGEANELLDAFLLIQDLADYVPVLVVLESDMEDIEKFIEIMSQLSMLTTEDIFPLIQSFSPSLLENMKKYAYQKELNNNEMQPYSEEERRILDNFKLFRLFVKNRHAAGIQLLTSGILIGQTLADYLPYVGNELKKEDKVQVSLDIISLLLLTKDGYNNPIKAFREMDQRLFDDVADNMRIDTIIMQGIGEFEAFKAKHRIEGGQS